MESCSSKVCSNLPLQMSLFFNLYFFPFWLIFTLVQLEVKYICLSTLYQFIVPTILVLIVIIESIRLYLGYFGNLSEKVAELTGFWLLSLFLQAPMQLFLLVDENIKPLPPDRLMQSIMLIFLIMQILSGYFAIKKLTINQAALFQLSQLYRTSQSHEKPI